MSTRNPPHVLLIIPTGLFLLSILVTNSQGPYYFFTNFEDYAYLFNALNILTFHVPAHVDHPGTTLQILGAVIVLGKWLASVLFGIWQPLQNAVLSDPEGFLHAINLGVNLALGVTAYFAARLIYRISGSLAMALTVQASPILFRQMVLVLGRVQAEPLLILAGFALAVPITQLLFAPRTDPQEADIRPALTAGIIFAFGVVSKITFLTLLPLLLIFRNRKSVAWFALAALAAGTVFLAPVLPQLPQMFRWFTDLLIHTGRYGSGNVGVIKTGTFIPNLIQLMRDEPALFVLEGYYLLVLVLRRLSRHKTSLDGPIDKVLLGGSLAILIQILVVVRQAPAAHYLLPCLVGAVVVNTVLVGAMDAGNFPAATKILMLAPLAVIALWAIIRTGSQLAIWARVEDGYRQDVQALASRRRQMPECTYIGYFRCSLLTFALGYGDGYSSGAHRALLAELYPEAINLNVFSRTLSSFAGSIQVADIRRWVSQGRCVVMEGAVAGTPYSMGTQSRDMMTGLSLVPVMVAGPEALYRLSLQSGQEPGELLAEPNLPRGTIIIEAEDFFSAVNLVVDRDHFGQGIGVVRSARVPGRVEYSVRVPQAGRYEFFVRYASAEARPLHMLLNGKLVSRLAASESTGGYDVKDQLWQSVGVFDFVQGHNSLRLESEGAFPHLDKLAIASAPSRGDKP